MKTQRPKSGFLLPEFRGGEARRDSTAELAASGCCAIPGTSLSICISEQVGLAIERHYRELRAAPRQPASLTTGILLGRYETGKRKIASLEQLYPVAWRPAYDSEPRPLTPGQLFSPLVSGEAKLQPVGFYVFAGRPDAALLHRDLSFFSLYFTNPDSIFVLFSRTMAAAIVAHVYARGSAKVPLHSVGVTLHLNDLVPGPQSSPSIATIHPLSALAADAPSAIPKSAASSGPPPENTPLPQPISRAPSTVPSSPIATSHPPPQPDFDTSSAILAQSSPLTASEALPEVAANMPASSLRNTPSAIPPPTVPWSPPTSHPLPNPDVDAPNRVPRDTLWAVVAITVLSAGAAWYMLSNRTLKSFTPDRIGLRLVQTGPDVEIAWGASSPALQGATVAVFQIRDGTGNKDITLSPEELKRGRLLYIPVTNDLDVHMRVLKPDNRTAEDSVRMIGGPPRSTGSPNRAAGRPCPPPVLQARTKSR